MPILSAFFIRTALIYLALGFSLGSLMLLNKALALAPTFWGMLPAHIEFLFVGWTIQLILGVVYWILPRFSEGPARGKVELAWFSYILLNAGLWMYQLSPLFHEITWLPLVSRLVETSAAVAFVMHAWPRVKPTGK
jgi:hypothetical protein